MNNIIPTVTNEVIYIRASEAAKILNIGVSTWYSWLNTRHKEMPSPIQLSRRCVVYDKAEVVAFAENIKNKNTN